MSWRNLLASIFGDFCGGSNCPGVTPTIPAKKADAREFQDCYCAEIGLCWAPSSRMIDRISPTIRNEPVTRIQPRPRANADARITAWRGCESSSAARSSSSAKRRSSPGAHDAGPVVDLMQMTTSTRCCLRRSSISIYRQIRPVRATGAVVGSGSDGVNLKRSPLHVLAEPARF